ncbi:hypothetical protein ERJ75_001354700 [Trypanosoma vivax]|uniref:Uncharacterized protein n=1 Tax=Trypanosoma vivax (strain Y486) TaxID=1055687 RepID=G0UCV0_TRYVY|nr:hypothetical protein TRVL_00876 [Trypanosoma vivax]KAH8607858.1 hypothetical protein ERJ75_001354700 [Trypanosoma vivax]CCC53660.1 conserved hypothetical protein [Trypanosoma vivax Y486]
MEETTSTSLTIKLSECFPVEGECSHSCDSVGWSPHNVLHVATRHAVYLHVNDLVVADAKIRPPYLPRGDRRSQVHIVSAKWATDLVSTDFYPATCNLCVRTTRDLFIYRVARYGLGRLRVGSVICLRPLTEWAETKTDIGTVETGTKRARARKPKSSKVEGSSGDDEDCGSANADGDDVAGTERAEIDDGTGWCILFYQWFSHVDLVVVTCCCIYVLSAPIDAGEEVEELGKRDEKFPTPAYCFTEDPIASIRPSCAARVANTPAASMRLVVASPYFLRVFAVQPPGVQLLYYVEVPELTGVPTALCSFGVGDVNGDSACLRVFASAPMLVLCGDIVDGVASMHESSDAAANMQNCGVDGSKEVSRCEWKLRRLWGPDDALEDEIAVNSFLVISLDSFAPMEVNNIDACAVVSDPPFIVLGICQRRLLGFSLRSCTQLIRCARADTFNSPGDVAVGLSGVALHPSCTMSVVAVQSGSRQYHGFSLFPVTIFTERSFLLRLLQCQERLATFFVEKERLRRWNTYQVETALDFSAAYDMLSGLWRVQRSTVYFLWERLLPRSALTSDLFPCYDPRQNDESKLILRGSANLGPSAHETRKSVDALRLQYIELRKLFGLELFLRYPENTAEWRQVLLRLFRFSRDRFTLLELLLANAVQLLAEATRYSGFKRRGVGAISEGAQSGSYSALQLSAALQFCKLFVDNKMSSEAWTRCEKFLGQICDFLEIVKAHLASWKQNSLEEPPTNTSGALKLTKSCGVSPLFPCSICGSAEQNDMRLSLSSTNYAKTEAEITTGCSSGHHATFFSGYSFIPLMFLSEHEVLSRCHSCGLYDYAQGALCRVCDGLMM